VGVLKIFLPLVLFLIDRLNSLSLQRAFKALMEGDRDSVLVEIESLPNSDEVNWLRANATENEDERISLLNQLTRSSNAMISDQAFRIIEREKKFEETINSEPGWKFWKQGDWPEKRKKYLGQLLLVLSLALVLFATIYISRGLNFGSQNVEEQYLQLTATAMANFPNTITQASTPTVTAIPLQERPFVSYPSGSLAVIRIENPTDRPVVFSRYEDSTSAAPAKGSYFYAIQLEFKCNKAICDSPPEAEIGLKLVDQNVVIYNGYERPTIADQPVMERIAQGESVIGWYVFEVPNTNRPVSLIINWSQEEAPLELDLPK